MGWLRNAPTLRGYYWLRWSEAQAGGEMVEIEPIQSGDDAGRVKVHRIGFHRDEACFTDDVLFALAQWWSEPIKMPSDK
ncbi:hypothetical protein [Caballeronia sp. AZ10_KS36]|uniref:hypothetical protein n=1 Tax=Caballeronia sp. AZ10_KS36 TaxID=2921757 RepID=UPI00202805E0|nr:hypothetical protein [Caballeronia sp. AZ10_KS36]